MNTLPHSASCARNRLLTLLCKFNVNVVLSGSANRCFVVTWSHCKTPEEVCVVKGNTLPDTKSAPLYFFFFLLTLAESNLKMVYYLNDSVP